MARVVIRICIIDLTGLDWHKRPTRREYERAREITSRMAMFTAEWPIIGGPLVIGCTVETE